MRSFSKGSLDLGGAALIVVVAVVANNLPALHSLLHQTNTEARTASLAILLLEALRHRLNLVGVPGFW